MSSTNRSAIRSPNDYYKTDPKEIVRFLKGWCDTDPSARAFWESPRKILDPAAGGLTEQLVVEQKGDKPPLVFSPSEMSYPTAITAFGHSLTPRVVHTIDTLDIRENSRAAVTGDFLVLPDWTFQDQGYDASITNPPFSVSLAYVQKCLHVVKHGGYVVKLLPLPFFESQKRNAWLLAGNMPQYSYVFPNRLSFTPDGHTDSIPYQHAIWIVGESCYETKLRVLKY